LQFINLKWCRRWTLPSTSSIDSASKLTQTTASLQAIHADVLRHTATPRPAGDYKPKALDDSAA
jgi:hypothetical protein